MTASRLLRAGMAVVLACGLGLAGSAPVAAQAVPTCDGLVATVDLAAGQVPTPGPDVVVGTPGADVIVAGGGDDVVCGGGGDDVIAGGAGDDRVLGGDGNDVIYGGEGRDDIDGGAGDDIVLGNAGDDVIAGGAGADSLSGGDGDDALDGGEGDDALYGLGGADVIIGGPGSDIVQGGVGADQIDAGADGDVVAGNDGDDTIDAGDGADVVYGGAGADGIAAGEGDDVVVGGPGDDVIDGGSGNDRLSGNADDDAIDGGDGDDEIYGTGGADMLEGGPGGDVVLGGDGDDVIGVADGEADLVSGNAGADTCRSDADLDAVFECVEAPLVEGPFAIGFMVGNAGSLTPQEHHLRAVLEGNGHTVTPFTVTAEPIVDAVSHPEIDLLLFSPSFVYSQLYHPAQPDALPMLDMAKNSWYRRYVVPWGDQVVGPRYSVISDISTDVYYDDAGVIDWPGQAEGPVPVLTAPRYSGGSLMRSVMEHSTNGAAQHFLRHVSDTGAESTIGVYVPPGSTITEPFADAADEVSHTSVAPWLGLVLFNDDWIAGDQYTLLTSAGESLFEAAMMRIMNP